MISVSQPPPVGSRIDRHVLDLGRMIFVGQQVHTQVAFIPSDPCPWSPITVTKHLVASGHENGNRAGIWDRHHGIKVTDLTGHNEVVNAVAINPVDESMAVTVSDDMKIRVWRSKQSQRCAE
jgi:WD40 repeat protein